MSSVEHEYKQRAAEQTRMLTLTANACRLLAEDISESAYNKVVDLLASTFSAESAVLFFMNGQGQKSAAVSGSNFPLRLGEKEWENRAAQFRKVKTSRGLAPWLYSNLPYWIGAGIISSGVLLGWFKVGRASSDWMDYEERGLADVADAIASVVAARNEREREEIERQRAEKKLAESERRLRAFIEESRDMIYTVDDSDIITDINPAGLNMLGGLPYEEVVGRQFEDFVLNPEDRSFFRQRIADEGYVDGYEIILKRGDQSTIFCVETTHSIRDQKGTFLELRGIVKDISERIKNEKELWRSNMELAEANLKLQQTQMLMVQREKLASIGQLAAGIAHEINNPLGFLKSNHIAMERFMGKLRGAWKEVQGSDWPGFRAIAEKWDLDYISNELDKIFEESNEGYARIMQIVSNLKNFSRIEADGDFELYDINAGIESTILVAWNELKYVAEVKKELGLVPQIRARGGEINQVILNILVNAAQAIGSQKRTGKGIITIKTAVKNAMVVCVISDDGPGIPENIRMRIFDPFFTTKEPGKGTGLGLSISYDIIVNKHKGFLHVESEPHRGSSFIIELPLSVSA